MSVILLGRLVHFFLMLVILKTVTALLSPAELGKIALITSAVAFFSSFLINPVGMYVNRQLHTWNSKGVVSQWLGFLGVYILISAVISAFILGIVNYSECLNIGLSSVFVFCFVLFTLLFNTINQTTIPSLNMFGFRGYFTFLSILTLLLGLLFAVLLVDSYGFYSEYWLSGLVLGQSVVGLIGGVVLYSKVNHVEDNNIKPSLHGIWRVFKFSWPIAITVGLAWFQSQSYRFFIEDTLGLQVLGFFVAGYGISAGIIAGFESVFTMYYQPIFYSKISEGNEEQRRQAWNHYATAILPSLIVVFFIISALAPQFTRLLLAPKFHSAAQFVIWGACAETFRVIVNVYSMAAHAEKNTQLLILPNCVGACVSLLLLYCLIPKLGVVGAGIALCLSGFSVVLMLHTRIKRELAVCFPYQTIGEAIGFGLLIWAANYYYQLWFVPDLTIIPVLSQLGVTGLFFLMAECFLLKFSAIGPGNGL